MRKNKTISILLACLAGACFIGSQASAAQLLGTIHEIPQIDGTYDATNDLTTVGTTDWIEWEETFEQHSGLWDHKSGGPEAFSDLSIYGADGANSGRLRKLWWTWTDGSTNVNNDPGQSDSFANRGGPGNGVTFTVKADTTTKFIRVWFVARDGTSVLTASLPGAGTISFTNDNHGDYVRCRYAEIQFAANAPNQTLTITHYVNTFGALGADTAAGFAAAAMMPTPNVGISQQPVSQTNFLPYATQFSVEAAGGQPITYQWYQQVNGSYVALTDNTRISGSTTPTLTITNQVATDATNYQVVVSSPYGGPITSSAANLTLMTQTSTLIGGRSAAVSAVNLTLGGDVDWAHWGLVDLTSFDQKSGGSGAIGNYTAINGSDPSLGRLYQDNGAHQTASWSDGTPDASATDSSTAIVQERVGNGFQIPVAASTTEQILTVYLWVKSTKIHFEAVMSDYSGAYIDETEVAAGVGQLIPYTLQVAASSVGKTINIQAYSLLDNDASGNHGYIALMSATLQTPGPKITLQPVPTTNFITTTATFMASGGGELPISQRWYVQSNGVYRALADGGQYSGTATPVLTISVVTLANATNYYLVATNVYGPATSSAAHLTVVTGAGVMQGGFQKVTNSSTVFNLTAEGTLDWANWGFASAGDYNHKAVGGSPVGLISDWTAYQLGSGVLEFDGFSGLLYGYSWTDGTPTDSASTTGFGTANWVDIYNQVGSGFQFTVPADTTRRVLKVYAGGHNCQVRIQAALSDGSAPDFINDSLDTVLNGGNDIYGYATIYYAAGAASQTLTITVYDRVGYSVGHAALSSATLATPTPITLTESWAGSNLKLSWPYGLLQQATSVTGPWTTIGSASPYTVTPSAPPMFYRVKVE